MRPSVFDLARAHIENGGECGDAGNVMHHDSAREVEHAPAGQDSAAPDHVDKREVDADQPGREKQHVGLERHSIGEGPGDEGWRDDGEHHLVRTEDDHRDGGVDRRRHVEGDPGEERPVEIADDSAQIGSALQITAEAHRKTKRPPEHRGPAHRHKALHHDREHVPAAHQPAVEEGQARRHEHDEAGAQEHEGSVPGVDGHGMHGDLLFGDAIMASFRLSEKGIQVSTQLRPQAASLPRLNV